MIVTNPKTGETVDSPYSPQEAVDICAKQKKNNFLQSLVSQHEERGLTNVQWFYIHKNAVKAPKPDLPPVELQSDLYEWITEAGLKRLMWKVDEKARVRLYVDEEGKKLDVVYSGGDTARNVGYIKGKELFPKHLCPNEAIVQIVMLAVYKMTFLTNYGKQWGICCVCGSPLINETSVAMGIGPICAGRFG